MKDYIRVVYDFDNPKSVRDSLRLIEYLAGKGVDFRLTHRDETRSKDMPPRIIISSGKTKFYYLAQDLSDNVFNENIRVIIKRVKESQLERVADAV